jgi:hypothetical protein
MIDGTNSHSLNLRQYNFFYLLIKTIALVVRF